MMRSMESVVVKYYSELLNKMGITYYPENTPIPNRKDIEKALQQGKSKSGGTGNRLDIKLYLSNGKHSILVIIEAKGAKNKLEKLNNKGEIEQEIKKNGLLDYSVVQKYAINGAKHYGDIIINNVPNEDSVIIIGINGTRLKPDGVTLADPEAKAYYISRGNAGEPKLIPEITATDWSLLKQENLDKLFEEVIPRLSLTDEEFIEKKRIAEISLEAKVKDIHQEIYDNERLKTALGTNEKLYLFTGLIMAGLKSNNIMPFDPEDFKGNKTGKRTDGKLLLTQIDDFLNDKKGITEDKIKTINGYLRGVFTNPVLEKVENGKSLINILYTKVKNEIIPLLNSNLHLDFAGKIFNSLNDWVQIENDRENDVVLTPHYITDFMNRLTRTNMDSYVWDRAMGTGSFLVSAMSQMLQDAKNKITDKQALKEKQQHIKSQQVLGVEILGNVYMLAVLNMILLGDGSSNLIRGDSHTFFEQTDNRKKYDEFIKKSNVFLLNPPYSADGKGFNFVQETLSIMSQGYAAILIQENAGSGNGLPYTKKILEDNTLIASIHMNDKLFIGKSTVQTAIYVFKVNRPHEKDDLVKFIDFSEDGYTRLSRKKSTQEVNLRDSDHAKDRYDEVVAIVNGKKTKTKYYTKENGKLIEDTVSLEGNDWTFNQHVKVDITPTEKDFMKTVGDYLSWKVNDSLSKDV